jgi:SRSO17 transposase
MHTLLIRRATTATVTKQHPEGIYEVEYFLAHHRTGVPIPQLIAAAGWRWNIEDDNRAGKQEVGLGDYQVRKWTPFYRHVTISMLAHAFLAATRARLGKDPANCPNPALGASAPS